MEYLTDCRWFAKANMSREPKSYWVYIMSNRSRTLCTGMTNNLEQRVGQHNVDKLVWYLEFDDVDDAILLEKKIKGWKRSKKIALIEKENPDWIDLSEDWVD